MRALSFSMDELSFHIAFLVFEFWCEIDLRR